MGSIGCTDELQVASDGGGGGGGGGEKIFVSVRLRPLNAKELERSDPCDWECANSTTVVCKNSLPERSMYPAAYTFDRVFGCESSTKQVYEEGVKEVVLSVVRGINSSVFAYGQTSSGKTFTMSGVTEYAVADIYDYIQKHREREFVLKLSAMEIYNEAVRDLLSLDSSPLRLLDDPERGTTVEKLTEETLRDEDHLKELLTLCEAQRQIGETSLNEMSSRSHQILRLTIESAAKEFLSKEISSTLSATVNFVDLAGSERASQALSAGTRLKEGCHINRSLLTLGTVIRKLSKGRNGHIPYRDSKLTRILQPSLGGNARTAIICTMSPARSHIEQSRNTLLFASCAKEVSTNAKVNLVMSDKALVKHLQRELARLESELRYSGSASCSSHYEILRDKDVQIKKMEREIKELIQQRNLAQSRLEDILQALGDDQASLRWDETSQCSISHVHEASEDVFSVSEISGIAYENPYFDTIKTDNQHESCNALEQHIALSTHSGSCTSFTQRKMEEMTEIMSQNSEEHCKEVQCIEVHASRTNQSEEFNLLLTDETESLLPHREEDKLGVLLSQPAEDFHPRAQMELPQSVPINCVESCSEESDLLPTVQNAMSSRELLLTKSRSCKPNLMTDPISSWYGHSEQDNKTPPNSFLKEFCGRHEGVQIRFASSQYDAEKEEVSVEVPHASKRLTFSDLVKAQDIQDIREENSISPIDSLIDKMDEGGHDHKQLSDDQETRMRERQDNEVEITVKDVGIDLKPSSLLAPSRWEEEFERKQHEIIELWNSCNVSLVHRTYFFLLFKGDPADSFYMEVERRRLSFLRNTFSHGNTSNIVAEDGRTFNLATSMRYLRREREMLYRQMKKKLSLDERKIIYTKWGISLDSKQRRLQVIRHVWTRTDMDHVRESASLVAKLVGVLQEGQALKEMFELSFAMQPIHRRSFSWKHRKSPFIWQ